MTTILKGIAVKIGSTVVHKMKDDGTAVLGTSSTESDVTLKGDVMINHVTGHEGDTLAQILNDMAADRGSVGSDLDSEIARATAREDAIEAAFQAADATLTTNIQTLQSDVDTNESDFDTAIAAVQADEDANEAAAATARAAIQDDVDANEAAAEASFIAAAAANAQARAQLQADVDQNEAAFDADLAAIQADEDQNEADFEVSMIASAAANAQARATLQADVDQKEAAFDAALAAIQADEDANEADFDLADSDMSDAIAEEFNQRGEDDDDLQAAINTMQADVDANEAAFDASMASLSSDLAASGSARSSADIVLQQQLDVNIAARQAHDATMTGLIAVLESNTDPAAVDSLSEALTAINNMSSSQATEVQNLLDTYNANIDAHKADNTATFAALQSDVDGNEVDFEASYTTNVAAISQETSDRQAADAVLLAAIQTVQADVDANEADTDTADAALQANIDAEETARMLNDGGVNSAINSLQADVDANEADTDTADAALQAAIDAEAATRAAADIALNADLFAVDVDEGANNAAFVTSRDTLTNDIIQAGWDRSGADNTLSNDLGAVDTDRLGNKDDFDQSLADIQIDVNQNEADFDAALAAIQADEDANEADFDTAMANMNSSAATQRAAIQADVDQNEADFDAAIAAVQADEDANEAAFDADMAAKQANLDAETAARIAADAVLTQAIADVQADEDSNEAANATARAALETRLANELSAEATARTTELSTAVLAVRDGTDPLVSDAGYPVLDTLGELATALGNDENFAVTTAASFASASVGLTGAFDYAFGMNIDRQNELGDVSAARHTQFAQLGADIGAEQVRAEAEEGLLAIKLQGFSADGTVYGDQHVAMRLDASDGATAGEVKLVKDDVHSFDLGDGTTYTHNYDSAADGTMIFVARPNSKFAVAPKFYFKEDGEWHPMPFSRTLDPAGDQDMDGVLNASDFYPYDPGHFDGVSGDPYLPFYNGYGNADVKWKTEVDGMTASELAAFDGTTTLPAVGSTADLQGSGWSEYIPGVGTFYNRVYLPIVPDNTTITSLTVYDAAGTGVYVGAGFWFTNYATYKRVAVSAQGWNGSSYDMIANHWQFKRAPEGQIYMRQSDSVRDGNGDVILGGDGYPTSDGAWTGWMEIDADDDGLTGVLESDPFTPLMKITEDAARSFNTTGFNIATPATTITPAWDLIQNGVTAAVDYTWAGQETYEIIGGAQAASFSISRLTEGYQGVIAQYTAPGTPSGALYWTSQPADGTYEVTVRVTVPKQSPEQVTDETVIEQTFVFTVSSSVQYNVPYVVTSVDNWPDEFGMFIDGSTEIALGTLTPAGATGTIGMQDDGTAVLVSITDGYGDSGPTLSITDSAGNVVWTESADNGIQTPATEDFSFSFDGTTLTVTDSGGSSTALLTWDSATSTWS